MTPNAPHPDPLRRRRLAGVLLLAVLLATMPGCATLAGFPFSPVTGAVSSVIHNECEGWDVLWGYPLGFIAGCLWGPVMVVSIGISADVGYASNGAYGENDYPEFLDVFDPYGRALARPDPPEAPESR